MARDISIAISARDNFTDAITTMRNANQGFNKDLEGLQQKLNTFNNTKVSVKMETEQLKQELQDARKQFNQTGDAADEMVLRMAEANYEKAQENLRLVGRHAREAEKEILNLTDAFSKAENRVGGGSGSGMGAVETQGILSSLATAGLGKMVGDSLAGAANVAIGSAFGDEMGSAISTTLSGALSGAAMGSIAGPIGAAIGAGVGLVAGGMNAATDYFTKKDDILKSYRSDSVEGVLQSQQDTLNQGIHVAMGRQKTNVQLEHMFGDRDLAQQYLDDTINLANQTPFFYSDLVGVGAAYKSFGFQNDELYEEQLRIANAAAIRGWEASDMEGVASTLGFMRQSGKIDSQRVKQLQMKGLNVPRYLAIAGSQLDEELTDEDILRLINSSDEELKAAGITLSEDDIYEMISKGEIDGKQAARALSDYMAIEFAGGAEKLAGTYYGLESTLGGLQEQMQNAMGEGYTEIRQRSLEEQIDWMSNDSGDGVQDAYKMIGQWQASLDNSKEQIERDFLTAIMDGNASELSGVYSDEQIQKLTQLAADYQAAIAEENGAEAGRILAQAQIDAQLEYDSSEGAIALKGMMERLHQDTTESLINNQSLIDAEKRLGEAQGKGCLSGICCRQLARFAVQWSGVNIRQKEREQNGHNIRLCAGVLRGPEHRPPAFRHGGAGDPAQADLRGQAERQGF